MVAAHEYRKLQPSGYRGLFSNKGMLKRLCYGFYAASLQQVGGIAALTMYAALIYESLGWNQGKQALAINGIQAVLQLFVVLVNTFTVDRFGRKTLLIWGFAIQASALLILSSLVTVFPQNDNRSAAIAEVAMLFIVGLTYCWSNGPIAPTVATEIFPQHVRDKAFGISMLGQSSFLIAITQPWPEFNARVGGLSYWLLAGLNVVALVSVVLILPETKGVSLEHMDRIFGQVDAVEAGREQKMEGGLTRRNVGGASEKDEKIGSLTVEKV
jgi:MFS family permease